MPVGLIISTRCKEQYKSWHPDTEVRKCLLSTPLSAKPLLKPAECAQALRVSSVKYNRLLHQKQCN